MKRSKLVFAAIATTALAATLLVACDGRTAATETTFEITFDANGGTLAGGVSVMTTGADGKLTELPADPSFVDHTFNGWYTAKTDGTKITVATVFSANATVYAQWTANGSSGTDPVTPTYDEYTITFDAGDGSFLSDGSKTATLVTGTNGKLTELPERPEKTDADFLGWNTSLDGSGDYVDTEHQFTDDATVYAQYGTDGVANYAYCINDDDYGRLNKVVNDGADAADTSEYGFAKTGVSLTAGDVISFLLNDENAVLGEKLSYFVGRNGNGIEARSFTSQVTSVKILNTATYDISVKWYDDGSCFVLVIDDGSQSGITLPSIEVEGAPRVAMTKNGGGTPVALKTVAPTDLADYTFMTETGTVRLTEGDVISFTVTEEGGEPEAISKLGMNGASHGIKPESGGAVSVTADGAFSVFLRYYEGAGGAQGKWEVEMNDGKPMKLDVSAYYLVGSVSGWSAHEVYELKDGALDIYLTPEDAFKVAGAKKVGASYSVDWDRQFNYVGLSKYCKALVDTDTAGDGNIIVKEAGMYTVSVEDGYLSVVKQGDTPHYPDPSERPTVGAFYVVGTNSGWGIDVDYELKDGVVTVTLAAGTTFKIAAASATGGVDWDKSYDGTCLDDESKAYVEVVTSDYNNMKIKTAGTYTITLSNGTISVAVSNSELRIQN